MTLHHTRVLICDTLAEADRISHLVAEHVRLTRAEPGCLSFDIVRSHEDPCRFAVREAFRDRAAFEAHGARTRASAWWHQTQTVRREFRTSEE
jgi:quinol monooxygenase YgiN